MVWCGRRKRVFRLVLLAVQVAAKASLWEMVNSYSYLHYECPCPGGEKFMPCRLMASRLLMVVAVVAIIEAVGAYVQHLGPIDGVVLLMRAYSGVEALTRLGGFLLHLLLLLLPCLG